MRLFFAVFLSSIFALFAAGSGGAQQPVANEQPQAPVTISPEPLEHEPSDADAGDFKLSVKTSLINVTAIVHDGKGAVVHGLQKDDFILKEDGKPRPLRYFDVDNDLPLTLGLLVDTSGSQARYAEEERAASHAFLKQVLTRPQDRAFVERFDYRAILLHRLTSDTAALDLALQHLADPPEYQQHGGTEIWDSTIATLEQIVSKEEGRRALIIMTDGEDTASQSTLQDTVNAALLYDIPIYSILYTEKSIDIPFHPALWGTMTHAELGAYNMERLSQTTGGLAFAVSNRMPIKTIFAAIEEDLRSQYRFSFTPTPAPAMSFHKLNITINHGHYEIRTRAGYYSR